MLKSDVNLATMFLSIKDNLLANKTVPAFLTLNELEEYLYRKYGLSK